MIYWDLQRSVRKYTKFQKLGNVLVEEAGVHDNKYNDIYNDNHHDDEVNYRNEMKDNDMIPDFIKLIDDKNIKNNVENYKSDMKAKKILSFFHIRDLYPRFQYTDIAAHPAIVLLPYQVKSFSFIIRYLTL